MSTPADLIDACPVCDPGYPPASPALAIQATPGGVLTSHECAWCMSSWRTWRDTEGWPVERKLDPIQPAQAEVNRGVLEEALAEQDREARHAAA